MILRRVLLGILLLSCALLTSDTRAQEDVDAQARPGDDSATTLEGRQFELRDLLEAAGRYRDAGNLVEAAGALNRAGRLHLKLNSLKEALATYQAALADLKQAPDSSTTIDSLNGLGETYSRLGECPKAQASLQQAIILSEKANYRAGKAEALLTLSVCQNNDDHPLALRTAQEALILWKAEGRKPDIARSYAAVGQYHLAQSDLTESTQSYEEALSIWRELKVVDEEADTLTSLSYVEYRRGDWQSVLALLTRAQELLDEEADPNKLGRIASGLADTFIETGLPETGLVKYQQALEYFRQAQTRRDIIVAGWGIGKTYYILGNYPAALEHFENALKDAEALKDPTVVAMCNELLGRAYAALNDPTAALLRYEVALELYKRVGNPMEVARVRAFIGKVYQLLGRVERAREYYRSALGAFRTLSDRVNESVTLYALGSLELEHNNLDLAESYLSQSIDITENIRGVSTSRDLTAAFSATVHERYEKYIECLMRKHEADPGQGFNVRAFEISDLARARSLVELLRATQTNLLAGLDAQLGEQERSLRQTLRAKEDYKVSLLSAGDKKKELDALVADLTRLEKEYHELTEKIRASFPAFEQITKPAGSSLKQIQEEVVADNQTILLEYSLGEERSYVWVVARDSIKSYELPARALIDQSVKQVYPLLAASPRARRAGESDAAIQQLSEMLLLPVLSELKQERVIVVADGGLNYIPFQVLSVPSVDKEFFGARYEITNAPSAAVLGQLRKEASRRTPGAKLLAAFGDPVFESNYYRRKDLSAPEQVASTPESQSDDRRSAPREIEPNSDGIDLSAIEPLFYAKRELNNLRDLAGREDVFVADGFSATRERLLSTDLTQYTILHFATHGLLYPKRPENSGLVLSMVNDDGKALNGFVGLQDIYGLRAPVNLVVLSACNTALGKDVRGEGLLGLTRGFMYAGASTVVASLWQVSDESTAELMKEFYVNMLQKGMTPAGALRAAQNTIRQNPRWRSPYYWAGFTLHGVNQPIVRSTSTSGTNTWMILTGVALVLLLAGTLWLSRRRSLSQRRRADS